jgi:hypothetical protein
MISWISRILGGTNVLDTKLWNDAILRPAFVCFADVLGWSQMTRSAIDSGNGNEFVARARQSISAAYDDVRERQEKFRFFGEEPPPFEIKVFTDNIVIAWPMDGSLENYAAAEFTWMSSIIAKLQTSVVSGQFLLRGGVAVGQHYMDKDMAIGDALLDAVDLEKNAVWPRLLVHDSVRNLMRRHDRLYGVNYSSDHPGLVQDMSDGEIFVNYLDSAFDFIEEAGIDHDLLFAHKALIESGLSEHAGNQHVLEKYEWARSYHNWVCQDIANRYPEWVSEYGDVDPEQGALVAEAQSALEYVMPAPATPSPFRHVSTRDL